MDNQHTLIKGYRDLSQAEIDVINQIKEAGARVGTLVDRLNEMQRGDANSPVLPDQRWVAIGRTHLQQGFMALVRSVAKPTGFF